MTLPQKPYIIPPIYLTEQDNYLCMDALAWKTSPEKFNFLIFFKQKSQKKGVWEGKIRISAETIVNDMRMCTNEY